MRRRRQGQGHLCAELGERSPVQGCQPSMHGTAAPQAPAGHRPQQQQRAALVSGSTLASWRSSSASASPPSSSSQSSCCRGAAGAATQPPPPVGRCRWRAGAVGQPASGHASAASAAASSAAAAGPHAPSSAASASVAAAETRGCASSSERRSSTTTSAACRAWCHTAVHSSRACRPSPRSSAATAGGRGTAASRLRAMLGLLSASTDASRRSASARCCGTLLRASRQASCTL